MKKISPLKLGATQKKALNKKPRLSVFDDRASKAELRQLEVEGMQGGTSGGEVGQERKLNKRGFLSRSSSRTGIA